MAAIPFINYPQLPTEILANKIVLDTMNYYRKCDGQFQQLDNYEIIISELVAKHLNKSKLIKVFNAILARDIVKDAKPYDKLNRRTLQVAGDDLLAKQVIFELFNRMVFDFVYVGSLSASWKFEQAKPAYCLPFNYQQLQDALMQAQRDIELPENSWNKLLQI